MWSRDLTILGRPFRLSSINMEDEGSRPRWLLLRQTLWGKDHQPGEYFLEAAFSGSVSQVLEPKWVARKAAVAYSQHRWTLVELGWHDDDRKAGKPPHIFNVLVYAADGSYDDSEQQKLHREAIVAAMAVKS